VNLHDAIRYAYTLLPPPLAALPAKYHAPISLLLHSLSTGLLASRLAELLELDEYSTLSFLLGLTHDVHQKLVGDGLSTLKAAKIYVRARLDELGLSEYAGNIEDALEVDACGRGTPIRGLPEEVAGICHIADMAQGRMEGPALLYWLRENVGSLDGDLTVRFYSVMTPQPFARAYIMARLYQRHIAGKEHVALTSPWGLYVIAYRDELPEILEASWDELRIDPLIPYEDILGYEEERKGVDASLGSSKIRLAGDELKKGLWSTFARMFYRGVADPLSPVLPRDVEGLFVNIEFADVDFRELKPGESFRCGFCGLPHLAEQSLVTNMYGKISGAKVTTEKWNRFMPAHIRVKAWDSRGQRKAGIGMCPLCTLDAVAVRESGLTGRIDGFVSLSIPKPVPAALLGVLGGMLRARKRLRPLRMGEAGELQGILSGFTHEGLVVDYSTATVATAREVPEPKTENMFAKNRAGELRYLGVLLQLGLYPLKFLPGLDAGSPDRLLTTTVTFPALDFPVTGKKYSLLAPWAASLATAAGSLERSRGMAALRGEPLHAPLHLLSLDKGAYDRVSGMLREIGVRP